MGRTRGWRQGREPEIKQEWQAGKGVVEPGRKSAGFWKEYVGRVSTQ